MWGAGLETSPAFSPISSLPGGEEHTGSVHKERGCGLREGSALFRQVSLIHTSLADEGWTCKHIRQKQSSKFVASTLANHVPPHPCI